MLIAELNHRVKNMLAVVISIANATLRHTPSPEAFAETLIGRLHGMARAYSLLSNENWSEVLLRRPRVAGGQGPRPAQDRRGGPAIRLKPPQALALGLCVHELATNAAKYGALSNDERPGRVSVWAADGRPHPGRLARAGRSRSTCRRNETGFGFVLIKGQVEHQLGGGVPR